MDEDMKGVYLTQVINTNKEDGAKIIAYVKLTYDDPVFVQELEDINNQK